MSTLQRFLAVLLTMCASVYITGVYYTGEVDWCAMLFSSNEEYAGWRKLAAVFVAVVALCLWRCVRRFGRDDDIGLG